MQPLTFACPKCGRRMGVGLELMGKQVRCPHCRQIVVAPANQSGKSLAAVHADTPARSQRPTPPEAVGTDSAADEFPMQFAPAPREGSESIFSEEGASEDCALGAAAAARPTIVPDTGEPRPAARPELPPGMIDFDSTDSEPVVAPADNRFPVLGPPMPLTKKELSQPDFALMPKLEKASTARLPGVRSAPAADPKSEEVVNPFAKFSRPKLAPLPAAQPGAAARPAPAPVRSKWFWPLVIYAALMTLLAAYGLWR